MTQVTFTELRQNLARYLDEAVDSAAPVLVTRQGGKGNVVLMSEREFASWQETVHLLSSPRNAERLREATRSFDAGEEPAIVIPAGEALPQS
ncbi:type II toxin-antitoxin system Phd/YefM family antitoxin [Belnapia sp. T6]|uniref:Antitoxin n=1 Tax=Belnapia mucosa TaxID=2804532 RepID=A0ABS1VA87_9PROT|nr:type II toxin-antitoxin system Phd/YefM family antitoxin [Belnapia mucosa]MBL6458582.1 type II toxin-antitoxin system Phd/YefM family antitoxin [Belnapia mucosa]